MNIKFFRHVDKKTVLLLGTARSGTTWLANLLSTPFRYRLLFEPFHTDHIEKSYLIADRYYGEQPDSETIQFCDDALNDRIESNWIRQNVSKRFYLRNIRWWSKVIVLKDIRSNLFIPSYNTLYGDSLKIIVIIRNPFHVVESLSRAKFPWTLDIQTLLEQSEFGEKFNVPLEKLKQHCNTKTGIYAVRWVIENSFLINMPEKLDVHIYYYENLLKNPLQNMDEMCRLLNIKKSPRLEEIVKVLYHSYQKPLCKKEKRKQ